MKIIKITEGKEEIIIDNLDKKGINGVVMVDILMHDPMRRERDSYKLVSNLK